MYELYIDRRKKHEFKKNIEVVVSALRVDKAKLLFAFLEENFYILAFSQPI